MMEKEKFIVKFAEQFEESDIEKINETVEFKLLKTWDSLTSMSVQVMIEDEYNVKISSDDLLISKTVLELFELIKSKCKNE